MSEAELKALCAEWQRRLRLQDWDIQVRFARATEFDSKSTAGFNCASMNSGGYSYDNGSGAGRIALFHSASRGSTSGHYPVAPAVSVGFQTPSGDPFTNAGAGDFSLDAVTGEGALLRAAGYPPTLPGLSTSNYRDIGAAQHQDSGGGGSAGLSRARLVNAGGW